MALIRGKKLLPGLCQCEAIALGAIVQMAPEVNKKENIQV
jgi:hypothetical protein